MKNVKAASFYTYIIPETERAKLKLIKVKWGIQIAEIYPVWRETYNLINVDEREM